MGGSLGEAVAEVFVEDSRFAIGGAVQAGVAEVEEGEEVEEGVSAE